MKCIWLSNCSNTTPQEIQWLLYLRFKAANVFRINHVDTIRVKQISASRIAHCVPGVITRSIHRLKSQSCMPFLTKYTYCKIHIHLALNNTSFNEQINTSIDLMNFRFIIQLVILFHSVKNSIFFIALCALLISFWFEPSFDYYGSPTIRYATPR